ncbi:MAG TPA: ankyrin repeat domain-containing protein [Allosphingosinicella sp.]|nr:ankyrin repeat domain-containing protein [Allosphingosinicella sp.]
MDRPKEVPAQIWEAIADEDIDEVRRLFRENPQEINGYTYYAGGTYLHYAASHPSVAIVKALVDIGFEINKPGSLDGDVALTNACAAGHYEVARYLLDHGSVMDVSLSIRNPLFSCISGYVSHEAPPRETFLTVARLLLDRGIDAGARYTSKTMVDMDAIAFAWMWGRRDIARMIAEHLQGEKEAAITRALAEAETVAVGNATSREKFRRERYPPRRRGSKRA